ncbi:MAG: pitrilysin family protein [Bacteroidota bacterium]|nr:pitrilysin family protein [Bacteroidota bacterium]
MDFKTHVLSNGIKLIHVQAESPVAHCGFFINIGSRDEDKNECGMAHFIEHLFFKGTQKRKAFHVLSRLEDVGGELNAYTSKEDTCIQASFLKDYYPRTVELFSDIVFNSTFPEKAMDSERAVILDEINSYKDSPSEFIFDDYEEHFFQNHPLGRNILGTARQLKKIKQSDILSFIRRKYNTDQMVFASVGNIPFNKLVYLFEKYFGSVPVNIRESERVLFNSYQPFNLALKKHTHQVHAIIGNLGYSLNDPRRMGVHLLSNIIGGPGMVSRLNLALRERRGYSYNVESSYNPYSDTGLFSVYFSSDKEYLEKCMEIIEKEFDNLRNKPLGTMQLKKARQQIMGQLAISFESNENQMLSIGKSYLVYDRVDSLEEIFAKIEVVTASELMQIANEILNKDQMSTLIYK